MRTDTLIKTLIGYTINTGQSFRDLADDADVS